MSSTAAPLDLEGIVKRFPGVLALDTVNLRLAPGEIHALLGENGAGKSTLIKILTGIQAADAGRISRDGVAVTIDSPKAAARLGIVLVPQDILMVPGLSVGRNILLGLEGGWARRGRLNSAEHARVTQALAMVGAHFDPDTPASRLGVPHLRLAQIARGLVQAGKILVLDEPTAVLSEPDADHLLDRLDVLRRAGKAILYVTHRLSEVMRLADRLTILRDGRCVGCFARGDIDRSEIVRLMSKQGPADGVAPARTNGTADTAFDTPRLLVTDLSAAGRFSHVSLAVHRGSVVGIAGVQGSGHGHFLRAVAGIDGIDGGQVVLDGLPLTAGAVGQAVARGLLLVPADRRGAAVVGQRSVRENLVLSRRIRTVVRRFGLRWHRRERAMTQEYIDRLAIRPGTTEAGVASLSGGNQQKVALARALEGRARVLLVEEPTQGIDVGAKAEIHAVLRRVATEHDCAVVIATSEFEELIGLADEIHVMRSGRLVKHIAGSNATYHAILESALP